MSLSVINKAALESLNTSLYSNGEEVYVETYKERFLLDPDSSASLEDDQILLAYPNGRWVRVGQPSLLWLSEPEFWVSPSTGDDEASGIDSTHPLRTFEEFKRRVVSQFKRSNMDITCHMMDDATGVSLQINADWTSFGGYAVKVDGRDAYTVLATGNITDVVPVSSGDNQEWQIKADSVTWGDYLDRIVLITSGPNTGVVFTICKDLGDGWAHISQPGASESYNYDEMEVSIDDVFEIQSLVSLSDELTVTGTGRILFYQLGIALTGDTHSVSFYNSFAFLDSCELHTLDIVYGSVRASNCSIRTSPRAYNYAVLELWNGSCRQAPIAHNGGTLDFSDYTSFNRIRSGSGNGTFIVDYGWLAIYDCGGAMIIENGFILVTYGPGRIFGKGISGTKIAVLAGGALYYQEGLPPLLTGTEETDILVGSVEKAFTDLPFVDLTTLARVEETVASGS